MDLTGARWRTSSFSNGSTGGGGCVEVAFLPGAVALRDTKDRAKPPHSYPTADWRCLLAAIKTGEFGLSRVA
ncbi:MAG TPA: DUF397 domain-containing protein [Pseudonocardia sp.]